MLLQYADDEGQFGQSLQTKKISLKMYYDNLKKSSSYGSDSKDF